MTPDCSKCGTPMNLEIPAGTKVQFPRTTLYSCPRCGHFYERTTL